MKRHTRSWTTALPIMISIAACLPSSSSKPEDDGIAGVASLGTAAEETASEGEGASQEGAATETPFDPSGFLYLFGSLHSHHYARSRDGKVEGGDDGGWPEGVERSYPDGVSWRTYRMEHPDLYAGGDAPAAFRFGREAGGLDFMAITPHSHLTDPRELEFLVESAREAEGENYFPIFGEEWSTISSGNHINVFNITEHVTTASGRYDLLFEQWLPAYEGRHPTTGYGEKIFVQLNHPAHPSSPPDLQYGTDDFPSKAAWVSTLNRYSRLIEVLNGDFDDEYGAPYYLELLNEGFRIGASAGQDNHAQNWGTLNEFRVGAVVTEKSREALMRALYERRTYATEDRDIEFLFATGDGRHFMGEEIPFPGERIVLTITFHDRSEPERAYRVEVFYDDAEGGERARPLSPAPFPEPVREGTYRFEAPVAASGGYFLVHLRQLDGQNQDLWSSPIWIARP